MAPITLYRPRDLVTQASTHAVFPTLTVAPPRSTQKSLVGLKRLLRGRNLDRYGLETTVYDTQSSVLTGKLLDASGLPEATQQIHESGNTFMYNGDHNLLALVIGQPAVAQSFDIYYLHWAFNSTHCVQLGAHASYFITAALQGCSIFVVGDTASPTVYHLNANAEGAHDPQPEQAKIHKMDKRFEVARRTIGGSQKAFTSATMQDYMPAMLDAAGTAQLSDDLGITGTSWYHVSTRAFRSYWAVDDDQLLQYGTVFGVRDGGSWSFYFQRRTRHDYRYKTWKSGPARHAEWHVQCRKFWPA